MFVTFRRVFAWFLGYEGISIARSLVWVMCAMLQLQRARAGTYKTMVMLEYNLQNRAISLALRVNKLNMVEAGAAGGAESAVLNAAHAEASLDL